MEFDSAEWRKTRNQKLAEWIQNPDAVSFVLLFADACELWDDLIDRDKPYSDEQVHRAFWNLLVEMPLNPFFDQYKQSLIPILITGINAWQDANQLEKGDDEDKVFAFVLRDWYMEFVSFIIYLTRGREYMRKVSMDIRHFFTHQETLDEYREALR